MSKGKKKKNEEGKKKNEYRISKEGAPKARFLFTAIDHDSAPSSGTNENRHKLTCAAYRAPSPRGAKRRLPSIFGVPCSSFDIPAFGGSFFKRSLEKGIGPSGHLEGFFT
jgi:hypothetical protein